MSIAGGVLTRVTTPPWSLWERRCRVHFVRNLLALVPKSRSLKLPTDAHTRFGFYPGSGWGLRFDLMPEMIASASARSRPSGRRSWSLLEVVESWISLGLNPVRCGRAAGRIESPSSRKTTKPSTRRSGTRNNRARRRISISIWRLSGGAELDIAVVGRLRAAR